MKRVTIELSDAQYLLLQDRAAETLRAVPGLGTWSVEEQARALMLHELRRLCEEWPTPKNVEAEASAEEAAA